MTTSAQTVPLRLSDDWLTVSAISLLALILADMLHEGIGHALVALLTGAQSGVLSTVAWSSTFDSRLVAAGGTLVNLGAALGLWLWLRYARNASPQLRFFLLIGCAFNLLDGTGYFFFSGVTDFGDWAAVIAPMHPHWLWRTLLVVVGMAAYYGAVLGIGRGMARYTVVSAQESGRMRKLTLLPYLTAIVWSCVAALFNPVGMQLMWQSALPSTAGANSGLLWMQYPIPKAIAPRRAPEGIRRSYTWVSLAAALGLVFIFVVGRGITLHR